MGNQPLACLRMFPGSRECLFLNIPMKMTSGGVKYNLYHTDNI